MKLKIFLLLHIFLSIVCYSQSDSDLLKGHYRQLVRKHLDSGDVSSAREELDNAKRVAPEISSEFNDLESRIVKLERLQKEALLTRKRERDAKVKEEEAKVAQRRIEAVKNEKRIAIEREIAWKNSLPERRCACIDLAKFYRHLLEEEKSRSFIDKVKAYNLESSMKSYEKAAILLGRQVGEKSCLSSTDLTEVMNMSRKYDLIQSLSQKCDLPMIFN